MLSTSIDLEQSRLRKIFTLMQRHMTMVESHEITQKTIKKWEEIFPSKHLKYDKAKNIS